MIKEWGYIIISPYNFQAVRNIDDLYNETEWIHVQIISITGVRLVHITVRHKDFHHGFGVKMVWCCSNLKTEASICVVRELKKLQKQLKKSAYV